MEKQILAFSSSRVGNSAYLEKVVPLVKQVLGDRIYKAAFIPFASVDSYEEYHAKVVQAFASSNYQVEVATPDNARELVESSDMIMVGGGNTFKLLHDLYAYDVLGAIQQKVNSGTPYIGWSAGSNITGLSISTTNDMPIIEPASFKSLQFFPFQINPHYINEVREGHNGETRDQRLTEFVKLNRSIPVVCIPEGTALVLKNGVLKYYGETDGSLFTYEDGEVKKLPLEPLVKQLIS